MPNDAIGKVKQEQQLSTAVLAVGIVFLVAFLFLLLFLAVQLGYVDVGGKQRGPECTSYGGFLKQHDSLFNADWVLASRWDESKQRKLEASNLPSVWGQSPSWTQAHIESFLNKTPVRTQAFGSGCGATRLDESHPQHGEPMVCTANDGGAFAQAYKSAALHLIQHDTRYAGIYHSNPAGALDEYVQLHGNEMSDLARVAVQEIKTKYTEVGTCIAGTFWWYVFFGVIGVVVFVVSLARRRSIARLVQRLVLLVVMRLTGQKPRKQVVAQPKQDYVSYSNPMHE